MVSVSVFDHVRPVDADYPDGIYRVVGTGETVTLLRVADEDGRRVNTGDLIAVRADELDRFDAAENPDGNRPLGSVAASKLEMTYWSVRAFSRQLAARPLPTVVAGTLLLVGAVGEEALRLPEVASGGLLLAGALALAYVGSGRF